MRAVRTLRRVWRGLREGKPGRRFQDHYCRKHDPHSGDGRRFGFIVGGISLVVLGALLSILPLVPGSVLGGMGALLLCAESQAAARALDFVETWVRFALRRLRRTAHHLHR